MSTTDPRLEKLRQKFEEQKAKDDERKNSEMGFYPFFNIDFGTEAILRFLPDTNPDNYDLFLIKNNSHKLVINGKDEKVPCLQNYGKPCPICEASQAFYKKEGKESKNGKFYWRKEAYLARVVVIKDPITPKEGKTSFNNLICTVSLNGDLYKKIMSAVMSQSDPMPVSPDNLEDGTNFIISKVQNGKYASYNDSRFQRTPSKIPIPIDREKDLIDLRTLLKAEPSYDELEAMLQSSITGAAYDDGSSAFNKAQSRVTDLVNSTSASSSVDSVTTSDDDGSSTGNPSMDNIMLKLKERRERANQ